VIDTESLVRDLVETCNHSGFIHDRIKERDLFLCYVVICFVNYLEGGYYTRPLKKLASIGEIGDVTNIFNQDIKYKTPSHKEIFLECLDEISAVRDEEKIKKMFVESAFLLKASTLENLSVTDLLLVYEHLLQRLQFMNMGDRLTSDFEYQDPPFDFAELTSLLANKNGEHKAYDPYATTGEPTVSYALINKYASITTETIIQTSKYIKHKLLIAGVSIIDSKHSYALASEASVKAQSFDVAFTQYAPSETIGVAEYEKLRRFEMIYPDGRIDTETIFHKYREHGFIQHILWSLKSDGIGFVFLGRGPLHRQFESRARNLLLKNNSVDAVIQLPPKLVTSKTVPLYLVVLRKDRCKNKIIKFIDATSFCKFDGKCNRLINLEELADIYHSANSNSEIVSLVNIEDIDKNAALLTVSSYVSSEEERYEEIDVSFVRDELAEQQQYTDRLLSEINKKPVAT
jgi:type I restriction-modification system DNA methylase subunit